MNGPVSSSPASWVALLLAAMLLAGCGGATPPAEGAPELADRLTLVDRAVASGDETRIRRRVESLVAAAESARDAGRIDDVQADRILVAAQALLARLPEEPTPEPTPSETPTLSPSPDDDDEGEDDSSGPGKSDDDEDSGDDKEKGKGKSKGKGKGDDEGDGDD